MGVGRGTSAPTAAAVWAGRTCEVAGDVESPCRSFTSVAAAVPSIFGMLRSMRTKRYVPSSVPSAKRLGKLACLLTVRDDTHRDVPEPHTLQCSFELSSLELKRKVGITHQQDAVRKSVGRWVRGVEVVRQNVKGLVGT